MGRHIVGLHACGFARALPTLSCASMPPLYLGCAAVGMGCPRRVVYVSLASSQDTPYASGQSRSRY